MKRISFSILSLCASVAAFTQTTFSGGIYSNTTWTLSGSPYLITGNVVVFDQVTLTIDPGVVVKFDDNTGMEIRGTLVANGTTNDTILFTTSNAAPTAATWFGLTFKTDLNSSLSFSKIERATRAIDNFNAVFASWNVSNCRFDCNDVAGYLNSAETNNFSNCRFDNNGTAIAAEEYSNITNCDFIHNVTGIGYLFDTYITNCSFIGNTTGIDSYKANISGTTFSYNWVGLRIKLFTQSVVQNNTFTYNNVGLQVRGDPQLPATVSGNVICANLTWNVENQDYISIDFRNNCWCSEDSVGIAQYIYDGYDNVSLGLLSYSPWTQCTVGIQEENSVHPAFSMNTDGSSLLFTESMQEIRIYDAAGRLMQLREHSNEADISCLAPGIYVVQMLNAAGSMMSGEFTVR